MTTCTPSSSRDGCTGASHTTGRSSRRAQGDPPDTTERLQTQPWLDLQHALFTPDAQTAFIGVINRTMMMGRIRIQLDTFAKAAANWRPGYWAALQAGNFNLDMLVLNLTDVWAVGQEPYVDIEGIVTAVVTVSTGTGISGSTWGRDGIADDVPSPVAVAPRAPTRRRPGIRHSSRSVQRSPAWTSSRMGSARSWDDTPIVYYVEQELRGLPPGVDTAERKVVADRPDLVRLTTSHRTPG